MSSAIPLSERRYVQLPESSRPVLMVVVDTEEEFDWERFPDRKSTEVTAMQNVGLAQERCDAFGLKPCYVIDYPIVSQSQGVVDLKTYYGQGRCEIGAHLHPWVNPPLTETLSVANMYPGNLDRETEFKKIQVLRDEITKVFGKAPRAYKAGRYGFGPHTGDTLEKLGFDIDLSFSPPVNHSDSGGPDYSDEVSTPFWFGREGHLLELPLSGGFVGVAGSYAKSLYSLSRRLEFARVPGIFSRLKVVDRLLLSPEGFTLEELKQLTRFLFSRGQRVFSFAYHSSTLKPGCTEYVLNDEQLAAFLQTFTDYFEFFFGELNGVPGTPTEVYAQLEQLK
ncbi:polysaccharide deacetylase family protein [Congregibacter litoralis]|uniref:WalW protein n=1 Tax=Congregibacter litoralis KT71 TaxID=314285 RepID=A4A539_9GAMM|nr:polysaccharide deacetylase family protein [Congregibacter litoralis]EAQ98910.2 hypothetical protein KT71_09792 [Congregibacter litoralis KT71]